jgi:hypothetical protein
MAMSLFRNAFFELSVVSGQPQPDQTCIIHASLEQSRPDRLQKSVKDSASVRGLLEQ